MSGFAVVVNFDGTPADRGLLGQMAGLLSLRGPDQQRIRVAGWNQNVGLVHGKFATTRESAHEDQPLSVDGRLWISGQIRVDARESLWAALGDTQHGDLRHATDAELVLRAYGRWGADCAARLLGDFGFAVWDSPDRRLWCATDRMGMRPVFHFQTGDTVVVSNALDCVRLHPECPDDLDTRVVLDHLLHRHNTDASATVYRGIRRVEPGSWVVWQRGRERETRRYWSIPQEPPVVNRPPEELAEEFRDLLALAVKDRLRVPEAGLYLSGGLDSPTLAAQARNLVEKPERSLYCCCWVFPKTFGDDEEHYARLVGRRLGLTIDYLSQDHTFSCDWHSSRLHTPEPTYWTAVLASDQERIKDVLSRRRVFLYGEGPDAALTYEWGPYLRWILTNVKIGAGIHALAGHFAEHRQVPALRAAWQHVRQPGKARSGNGAVAPPAQWLSADARDVMRQDGQSSAGRPASTSENQDVRPQSRARLASNVWRSLFDAFDPSMHGSPVEMRYPYLDSRLLAFLLRIPAIPLCRNKAIIRRAMAGTLPAEILKRPKRPLRQNPWFLQSRAAGYSYPHPRAPHELMKYVDLPVLPFGKLVSGEDEFDLCQQVLGVDFWLANRASASSLRSGSIRRGSHREDQPGAPVGVPR